MPISTHARKSTHRPKRNGKKLRDGGSIIKRINFARYKFMQRNISSFQNVHQINLTNKNMREDPFEPVSSRDYEKLHLWRHHTHNKHKIQQHSQIHQVSICHTLLIIEQMYFMHALYWQVGSFRP